MFMEAGTLRALNAGR